jgi:hypothetical protein
MTYDVEQFTREIRDTYSRATADELQRGSSWYLEANQYAERLGEKYSLGIDVVSAVIAALSPNNSWEVNKRDADRLIGQWRGKKRVKGIASFRTNIKKALAILRTGDTSYLHGIKVTAFADNIARPKLSDKVTVDRHIWGVLTGKRYRPLEVPGVTPARVKVATEAYQKAARELGVRPLELQAVTWLVRKRDLAQAA